MIPLGILAASGGPKAPGPDYWTPADTSTSLWLDMADPDARTIINGAFRALTDKSGSGNSLGQTAAASRPALVARGLNGLDVAELDGVNDGFEAPADTVSVGRNVAELGMAILVRPDITNEDRRVWNSTVGGNNDNARLLVGFNASGNWRVGGRRLDNGTYAEDTSVPATPGQWVIFVACFDYSGATLSIRLNGEVKSSVPFDTPGTTSDTNSRRASFGAGLGANIFNISGRLAEMVVATDMADVEKIEGYIAHKWGLASLLPAGHPYKEVPPLPPV